MPVTRINPFESPRPSTTDDSPRWLSDLVPSRAVLGGLALVPLIATTGWAIYRVSPVGAALPAAIAFVAATLLTDSFRTTLLSIALAYALGVSTIILAIVVTELVCDPLRFTDDAWVDKVTRVWSGCGILGAVTGTVLGIGIKYVPSQDKAEPSHATERRS